jgi:uncharacterized membrane protein
MGHGHQVKRCRIGEARREIGGVDVLEVLVNPPQMALRIANPGYPLAEGQLGRVGDNSSARAERHFKEPDFGSGVLADHPRIDRVGGQNLSVAHEQGKPARTPGYRTTRMEAFSDGVFAIAITLLVLEIGVPSGSGDDLLGAVLDQWPSYLAYLVSFATIGAVWLEHTVITEHLDHATSVLIRLNLLLLMVVSFLPFPTQLLGEYIGEDEAARIAVTIYGTSLFLALALVSSLWRYAVRERLIRPDLPDVHVRMLTTKLTPGLAGYVAMIVLGLFLPVLAVFGYLAIAVYIIVPIGALRRATN